MIPLEGLSIEERESDDPDLFTFEIIDPQRNRIKYVKLESEAKEGTHEKFTLAAKTAEERRSWMAAVLHNIVANPIMGLINKKKEQMQYKKKEQRNTLKKPLLPQKGGSFDSKQEQES